MHANARTKFTAILFIVVAWLLRLATGATALAESPVLAGLSITGGVLQFQAQAGTRVVDVVETATNLSGTVVWTPVASVTNRAMPEASGFTNEWMLLPAYPLTLSASNAAYLRFSRCWLDW